MRYLSALLIAAGLLGCQSSEPASHGGDDAFDPLIDTLVPVLGSSLTQFIGGLRAHAGALRAGMGLRCGSESICSEGRPAADDRCEAEAEVWSAAFTRAFDPCLAEESDTITCFEAGLAAHTPSEEQQLHAALCRGDLVRCPELQTDACQALEALEDPALVERLRACGEKSCEALSQCLVDALLTGVPPLPAACTRRED